MKKFQSENLAREWDQDVYAAEIWDSLQEMENKPSDGLRNLKAIADAGSALAMMYVGHILLSGQFNIDEDISAGELWLRRSAKAESIEGGYRLSNVLLANGHLEGAFDMLSSLSSKGYGPASFVIGLENYRGTKIPKNLNTAIDYFSQASKVGHLPAKRWLAMIMARGEMGPSYRILGILRRLALVAPLLYFNFVRSGSDRLRIWI